MRDGRIRNWGLVGIALIAAAMSGGCGRAEAKTPGPTPALQTPEPPARLVIPVSIDPPAPTPTPIPTPTPVAPVRPAINTGGRATPPGLPPPVTQPPPETTPPPPTVLQTNASQAELETQAKEQLDRADKDLARIAGKPLSKDAREQFESAKRFIRMARDAMTAKNFVYAAYCADKAATLASLLAK